MSVSIIIVNWNTLDLLAGCLRSLRTDPEHSAWEVWVVDNASSDGSAEMVRSQFPEVRLIQGADNRGFAAANNLAIVQSRGDFVMLLNPDTEVQAGSIEKMAEYLTAHPRTGAVGPMIVGSDGALQPSASPAPTLAGEFVRMFHLEPRLASPEYPMGEWDGAVPRKVDVLQGACILLRRQALDQAGLLDERFFMYSEEVDLCQRLRQEGWSIFWLPQSRVLHHGGQSARQVPLESFLHLYRGKVMYFRKHHGVRTAVAYKLLLSAASLARLFISPLALLESRDQRTRHLALARHYRRLLTEVPRL